MAKWKEEHNGDFVLQGTGKMVDVTVTEDGLGWEFEISLENDNCLGAIETGTVASGCGFKGQRSAQNAAIKALRKLEAVFQKATAKALT